MRIAFSALVLLLLALTALAGSGCKRTLAGQAAHAQSFTRMAQLVQLGHSHRLLAPPRVQQSDPVFVFCHPRADQLDDASLSAAAAQVAFDLQANNDDRTEMITAHFAQAEVPRLPQAQVGAVPPAGSSAWPSVLLRPPRPALA